MSHKNSSSNPPRKFSEKIAKLKEKEAAITANFDQVMRGISDLNENMPHILGQEQVSKNSDFDVDIDLLIEDINPEKKKDSLFKENSSISNKQQNMNDLSKFHPHLSSALLNDNSQRLAAVNNPLSDGRVQHAMPGPQQNKPIFSQNTYQSVVTPNQGQYYSFTPLQQSQSMNHSSFAGNQQPPTMASPDLMVQQNQRMAAPLLSGAENTSYQPPPFFHSIPPEKAANLFGLDGNHKTSSLPNVNAIFNQASTHEHPSSHLKEVNRSNVDLQSALHNLQRMKNNPNQRSSRDRLVDHIRNRQNRKSLSPHPYSQPSMMVESRSSPCPFMASPPCVPVEQCSPGSSHDSYSPHHSPRHRPYTHRRNRSPYANPYLSPPGHNVGSSSHHISQNDLGDNWRRTASDSAIHQSLQDTSNNLNQINPATNSINQGPPNTFLSSQNPSLQHPNAIYTMPNCGTDGNISGFGPNMQNSQQMSNFMARHPLGQSNSPMSNITNNAAPNTQMFSCPTSPLSSVQQQFESIRMVDSPFGNCSNNQGQAQSSIILNNHNSTNYPPVANDFDMNLMGSESEITNRQSAPPDMMVTGNNTPLPDIILTEPEVGRRDSYTITNEFLSSLGTGDATLNQNGGLLLDDLSDTDFQILTDPSLANYVTDDYTEHQLLHEK